MRSSSPTRTTGAFIKRSSSGMRIARACEAVTVPEGRSHRTPNFTRTGDSLVLLRLNTSLLLFYIYNTSKLQLFPFETTISVVLLHNGTCRLRHVTGFGSWAAVQSSTETVSGISGSFHFTYTSYAKITSFISHCYRL
jgi:hypothetical protein